MNLRTKNQNGFTLIELLVVIIIVGILAALAVPKYLVARDKARGVEAIRQIGVIANEIKVRQDFEITIGSNIIDLGYDADPWGDAYSEMKFNYQFLPAGNRVRARWKQDGALTIIYVIDSSNWAGTHPGVPGAN